MERDLAKTERQGFRLRLAERLRLYAIGLSPSAVAQQFNLKAPGKQVSINAVRKWILGEAIPTQKNIQRLAEMLGTQAQWLRYGETTTANASESTEQIPHEVVLMLEDVQQLEPAARYLLDSLIRIMLEQQNNRS
jgi:transcriptional regulator with XRE-family HTH domain